MERTDLTSYRGWLASHIDAVLARASLHAASPAEAEITLLTLMEAYVAAWSVERGRSPERDVARVIGLWREACHRLHGSGALHARLCPPGPLASGAFDPATTRRLVEGMGRVWELVRVMCP